MLKNLATGEWGYFAIGAFSVTETICAANPCQAGVVLNAANIAGGKELNFPQQRALEILFPDSIGVFLIVIRSLGDTLHKPSKF
jgi:hypothetical protein